MAICPNCGTANQAGGTTCVRCGRFLEVIPDWLELLLARYGEAMPTFEGVSVERAPSTVPTKPLATQRTSSDISPPPTSTELEDAELLDEIERLKQSSVQEQPVSAETQPSEETGIAAAPSTAHTGMDDWLAELRALQARATSDVRLTTPAEEHLMEATPPVSQEVPSEREAHLSPESSAESAPIPQPDMLPRETSLPSIEERLGALVPPEDTTESTPEEAVPAWLRELGLVQAEQSSSLSSEPDQLSETLGPLPVAEAGQPEEAMESPSDEEIPDWLKRLIAISSQVSESSLSSEETAPSQARVRGETEATPAVEPAPEEALPDWLRELEARQTTPLSTPTLPEERETLPPQPGKPPMEMQEMPVASLSGVEEGTAPAVQQEEVSPAVAEEHPAEWLAELEELIERPPVSPPPPPTVEEEEVPDWLRELAAEKPEKSMTEPKPPVSVASAIPQPEPTALPEWISRLQPTEPTVETPLAESAAASPEASITPSRQDVVETLRARLGVPQVPDIEGAEMFREITSEPVETTLTPVSEEVEPTPRRSVAGVIIWALVFAAILLGIAILSLALLARIQELLGATAFQRFLNTPAAAGLVASLEQFRKPITALHQGEVVLLSIDYTPATAAEMQPLASVVLRDLLARRARVLTVSLQPEGAPLAQRLLDELTNTYPYGEYTLNLGYLPGEAIGVRSLAHLSTRQIYGSSDGACRLLHACPGWHDIQRIENVALFITVADSADSVRWWIEQLPRMSSGELPMLAAVSAAALPAVRPYLIAVPAASSRLTGLIGGMMATAAYEVYTGRAGRALNMVAAQSAAHLGLVAVALAGIFAGIRARTGHH